MNYFRLKSSKEESQELDQPEEKPQHKTKANLVHLKKAQGPNLHRKVLELDLHKEAPELGLPRKVREPSLHKRAQGLSLLKRAGGQNRQQKVLDQSPRKRKIRKISRLNF